MPLTDTAIKALRPKDKPYKIFDGGGLYIEVLPTGTKVWRIKYRKDKKEQRLTLGTYPQISLREARKELLDVKEKLSHKITPKKAASKAFRAVAAEWLRKQKLTLNETYFKEVSTRLDRLIYPGIGDAELTEITPPQILERILTPLERQEKHETAAKVLSICSRIFRYGVACGHVQSDPCRDLRGVLASKPVKSFAAITDPKEVGRLMAAIKGYEGYGAVRLAMLWSAYTFCRPGEVRRAEWREIVWDKQEWRIPPEKMKMRREHRVPLSAQCMSIIEILRAQRRSDIWLFPSPRPGKPLSENGVSAALRTMGFTKSEMTAHGFRSMASTLLNEQGYDFDVIEIQLAHVSKDAVRATYNRAQYWEKRVKMMQEWADYLDALSLAHQSGLAS